MLHELPCEPTVAERPAPRRADAHCHACGVAPIPALATIPYCEHCWEAAVAEGRVTVTSRGLSYDDTACVYLDGVAIDDLPFV